MEVLVKTPVAGKILGCLDHCLYGLMRTGKIPRPAKDSSGDFVWSQADIEAARRALAIDRRRSEHRGMPIYA